MSSKVYLSLVLYTLFYCCSSNVECTSSPQNAMLMCHHYPLFMRRKTALNCSSRDLDITAAALAYNSSLSALRECQTQFKDHPWNCPKNSFKKITKYAYRQTSFLFALYTASFAHHVTKACSQGILPDCQCAQNDDDMRMIDGKMVDTCSGRFVRYGVKESRRLLTNNRESDPKWEIDEHNKEVGRKAFLSVAAKTESRCVCYGTSGACAIKKCTPALPRLRDVGEKLSEKFKQVVQVTFNNRVTGNSRLRVDDGEGAPNKHQLVFSMPTPSHCQQITKGRECSMDTRAPNACGKLCCGRGHTSRVKKETTACKCKFSYCCEVECEKCSKHTLVHTCT